MDSEKNLHAFVPSPLLARAQEAARQEHITMDELVSDAMERHLNSKGFEEVMEFGKRHAEGRGLKQAYVSTAIAEERRTSSERMG